MHSARRRGGPSAGSAPQGRLPVGTPGTNTSFSHIRVLPKDEYLDDDDYEDSNSGVPVFRSPSYQVLSAMNTTGKCRDSMQQRSSATDNSHTGNTFADKVRASADPAGPVEGEAPSSSSIPPSGLVRLKAHKARGGKTWKTLDIGPVHGTGDDDDPFLADVDRSGTAFDESLRSSPVSFMSGQQMQPISAGAQLPPDSDHPPQQVRRQARESPEPFMPPEPFKGPELFKDTSVPSPTPLTFDDEIGKVFGERLPDPIFLSQWPGSTHGEIKFIQHPNRDVSAHEWDSAAYQWVNIGQFSANRKKIEGQLASERLRGQTISSSVPPNTLSYFRAVSKQREAAAHGQTARTEDNSPTTMIQRMNPAIPQRPKLQVVPTSSSLDQFGSLSTVSGTVGTLPTRSTLGLDNHPPPPVPQRLPPTSVAPSVGSFYSTSTNFNRQENGRGLPEDPFVVTHEQFPGIMRRSLPSALRPGAMDLRYQFPEDKSHVQNLKNTQNFASSQVINAPSHRPVPHGRRSPTPHGLREHRLPDHRNDRTLHHPRGSPSNRFFERMEHADIASLSGVSDDTTPDFGTPHYGMNESAGQPRLVTSRSPAEILSRPSQAPELSFKRQQATEYFTSSGDTSSDLQSPDTVEALREPPTPQNFRGPFFTEYESEEQRHSRLRTWWHSGILSERNKDIVERCTTNNTDSIDKGSTTLMFRVFENLESYATQKNDYFSRFAPPARRYIDRSEGGNKSYFSEDVAGLSLHDLWQRKGGREFVPGGVISDGWSRAGGQIDRM